MNERLFTELHHLVYEGARDHGILYYPNSYEYAVCLKATDGETWWPILHFGVLKGILQVEQPGSSRKKINLFYRVSPLPPEIESLATCIGEVNSIILSKEALSSPALPYVLAHDYSHTQFASLEENKRQAIKEAFYRLSDSSLWHNLKAFRTSLLTNTTLYGNSLYDDLPTIDELFAHARVDETVKQLWNPETANRMLLARDIVKKVRGILPEVNEFMTNSERSYQMDLPYLMNAVNKLRTMSQKTGSFPH